MDGEFKVYVGLARLELHVPEARSLKAKRGPTRSLIEKIRNRHKVLITEIDHQDLYQRAAFAICALSSDPVDVESRLSRVERTIYQHWAGTVLRWDVEFTQW